MADITTVNPSSYDFNDLMASAIRFFKSQEEWKDYNFDGAGLRELLRLMSYYAQQQAFENNFVISESFLDSAQLPNNAASFASSVLGYVAEGMKGARLNGVSIIVTPGDPANVRPSLILDQQARFFATKDSKPYNFCTLNEYQADYNEDGEYVFDDVTLVQGSRVLSSFVVESALGVEKYTIPNENIDLSTLEVVVKGNETSTGYEIYRRFRSGFDLGPNENIFFIRKNRQGFYEIEFGDGKIARKLDYGNIIVARYVVTDGESANGILTVNPTSDIGGNFDIKVITKDPAYGGTQPESIETTKFFAPLAFETQGSAVTDSDYISITKNIFPSAESVISWGGELNDPPKFGYTFIAVKPKDSEFLTQTQKDELFDLLSERNVGSITPVIVDPTWIYIHVNSTVRYNPNQTILTPTSLQSKIENYVTKYSTTELEKFNAEFDITDLNRYITTVDRSIKGNGLDVDFERKFVPELNEKYAYTFNFNTRILEGSIYVSGFRISDVDFQGYSYSVIDNGLGNLYLQKTKDNNQVILDRNYGSVDYATGKVLLSAFNPNTIVDGSVSVIVTPADNNDVYKGLRNAIMKISKIDIELEIVNV